MADIDFEVKSGVLLSQEQMQAIAAIIREKAPAGLPLRIVAMLSPNQDADLVAALFDMRTVKGAPNTAMYANCVFEHEQTERGLTEIQMKAKVSAGLDVIHKELARLEHHVEAA